MPTLLHLDSSADLSDSVSRALTDRFAQKWAARGSDYQVTRRDLHTDALPHLPTNVLHWAPRLRMPGSVPAESAALQRVLIEEVLAADVVVVGAPMYNWMVPSTLKAWIDYIQVGGWTSPFDEPTQPFAGKPIVIVSSRGDQYGPGTRNDGADYEIPSLRQVLGVALGMNVIVVTAELTLAASIPAMAGLIPQAQASLAEAQTQLDELAAELAAAC